MADIHSKWAICVAVCDYACVYAYALAPMYLLLLVAHAYTCVWCVPCIISVLTTNMRHLSSPLSESVCVPPRDGEGKLNHISVHHCWFIRLPIFSDPTHQKPKSGVFDGFMHDVFSHEWRCSVQVCVRECPCLYVCLWIRQCMTALSFVSLLFITLYLKKNQVKSLFI